MHIMDGYSVEATANVIRAHMLAMYFPSLFSGWLIARTGITQVLWLGLLLEAGAVAIALTGQTTTDYMLGLIMLGAGWNFLFLAGTTLLATHCQETSKYRVQGINEFVMFFTMAVASLLAGPLLSNFGWVATNVYAGLPLGLVILAILKARAAKASS
jgi:MFS family permease